MLLEPQVERPTEERLDVVSTPPVVWVPDTGRGRGEKRAHHAEHLALRRPRRQSDPASRSRHTCELVRDRSMIGGEHHAHARHHGVEARVPVRQLFRISNLERNLDTLFVGSGARSLDEHGCEIESDDICAALRREDRDRSRSSRSVEHRFSRLGVDPLDDECVHVAKRVRDALVRAVPPDHGLARLELGESHFPLLLCQRSPEHTTVREPPPVDDRAVCTTCGPDRTRRRQAWAMDYNETLKALWRLIGEDVRISVVADDPGEVNLASFTAQLPAPPESAGTGWRPLDTAPRSCEPPVVGAGHPTATLAVDSFVEGRLLRRDGRRGAAHRGVRVLVVRSGAPSSGETRVIEL